MSSSREQEKEAMTWDQQKDAMEMCEGKPSSHFTLILAFASDVALLAIAVAILLLV